MTTNIARINPRIATDFDLIMRVAALAVESKLTAHRSVPAAAVCIAKGMERGWQPFESLENYHVIDGKPSLTSHAILGLVMGSPMCEYFRCTQTDNSIATFETKRKNNPDVDVLTYTIDDAKRAGLANRATWRQHTAAMLRARCGTFLARAVYPDVVGTVYSDNEAREMAPAPAPVAVQHINPSQYCRKHAPFVRLHLRDVFGDVTRTALLNNHLQDPARVADHLEAGKTVPGAKPHHLLKGLNKIRQWYGQPHLQSLPAPEVEPLVNSETIEYDDELLEVKSEATPESPPAAPIDVRNEWLRVVGPDSSAAEAGSLAIGRLVALEVFANDNAARKGLFKHMKARAWDPKDTDKTVLFLATSAADLAHAHMLATVEVEV